MSAAASPLLELRGLTMRFGGLVAVLDLDLAVYPGEIVGLIGPNGAGKTTVFNCISRFYTPVAGGILFDGQPMTRIPAYQVVQRGVARTFQNVELCRSMTTLQNLLVGQHSVQRGGLLGDGLRLPGARRREAEAVAWADQVLALLDLTPYRERVVTGLPFGIQKRIELARALVSNPRLLLLDEPAAGADTQETAELTELIRRLHQQFGLSILLVEHDMSVVMGLCQRIAVLDFGRKIAEGTPAEVRSDPAVIEAYLGERV